MLIESFVPSPDAVETHHLEIGAPADVVYRALWTADLAGSPVIRALLLLRSLPTILARGRAPRARRRITLESLIAGGFGRLAEDPGREIVLGVAGRFWRPAGNVLPFREESFRGPVPPGLARAVWNFAVQPVEGSAARTVLSTETRVACGDRASRAKFRAYWALVRPFSGLIRILMLKAVRRECARAPRPGV